MKITCIFSLLPLFSTATLPPPSRKIIVKKDELEEAEHQVCGDFVAQQREQAACRKQLPSLQTLKDHPDDKEFEGYAEMAQRYHGDLLGSYNAVAIPFLNVLKRTGNVSGLRSFQRGLAEYKPTKEEVKTLKLIVRRAKRTADSTQRERLESLKQAPKANEKLLDKLIERCQGAIDSLDDHEEDSKGICTKRNKVGKVDRKRKESGKKRAKAALEPITETCTSSQSKAADEGAKREHLKEIGKPKEKSTTLKPKIFGSKSKAPAPKLRVSESKSQSPTLLPDEDLEDPFRSSDSLSGTLNLESSKGRVNITKARDSKGTRTKSSSKVLNQVKDVQDEKPRKSQVKTCNKGTSIVDSVRDSKTKKSEKKAEKGVKKDESKSSIKIRKSKRFESEKRPRDVVITKDKSKKRSNVSEAKEKSKADGSTNKERRSILELDKDDTPLEASKKCSDPLLLKKGGLEEGRSKQKTLKLTSSRDEIAPNQSKTSRKESTLYPRVVEKVKDLGGSSDDDEPNLSDSVDESEEIQKKFWDEDAEMDVGDWSSEELDVETKKKIKPRKASKDGEKASAKVSARKRIEEKKPKAGTGTDGSKRSKLVYLNAIGSDEGTHADFDDLEDSDESFEPEAEDDESDSDEEFEEVSDDGLEALQDEAGIQNMGIGDIGKGFNTLADVEEDIMNNLDKQDEEDEEGLRVCIVDSTTTIKKSLAQKKSSPDSSHSSGSKPHPESRGAILSRHSSNDSIVEDDAREEERADEDDQKSDTLNTPVDGETSAGFKQDGQKEETLNREKAQDPSNQGDKQQEPTGDENKDRASSNRDVNPDSQHDSNQEAGNNQDADGDHQKINHNLNHNVNRNIDQEDENNDPTSNAAFAIKPIYLWASSLLLVILLA